MFDLKNITFRHPGADQPLLRGLDFAVRPGECVVLTGESGSGKSTLARIAGGLIPEFHGGELRGETLFRGRPMADWGPELRRHIGMVFQDPERQMLATTVRRELVAGMEYFGMPRGEMRRSMAEVAGWLGLAPLLDRPCAELSGGEKQKVVIGAMLAMSPSALILDEPTSQLDPIAAAEVFAILRRLKDDFGMTLVLIEQHLDGCLPWADRVARLENGVIVCDLPPHDYCRWALDHEAPTPQVAVPLSVGPGKTPAIPMTVAEARRALPSPPPSAAASADAAALRPAARPEPCVLARAVCFSYDGNRQALRDVDFDAAPGEIVCILGGNGAGKSTLLATLLGLLRPSSGNVEVLGDPPWRLPSQERVRRIGYLSQNPDDHLAHDSIEEEIAFTRLQAGMDGSAGTDALLDALDLGALRLRHPQDLSAGERRRVALAAAMAADPAVLLLDEPTRGAGHALRARLAALLRRLAAEQDRSILIATQDVEFAAEIASRVVLMFDGEVVAAGPPAEILAGGLFFSTVWGRVFRGHPAAPQVLTRRDAIRWLEAR